MCIPTIELDEENVALMAGKPARGDHVGGLLKLSGSGVSAEGCRDRRFVVVHLTLECLGALEGALNDRRIRLREDGL
jgi:hypothetical protein